MKLHTFSALNLNTALMAGFFAAVMITGNYALSQGCGIITLQKLSVSTNATRYGFAELSNPSTPPKRYLDEKVTDHRIYSDTLDYFYFDPVDTWDTLTVTGNDLNSYDTISSSSISAIDGSVSGGCSGSAVINLLEVDLTYDPDYDPAGSGTHSSTARGTLGNNCVWSDGGTAANAEIAGWLEWSGYGTEHGPFGYLNSSITVVSTTDKTIISSSWSAPLTKQNVLNDYADAPLARNASISTVLSTENSDVRLRNTLIGFLPAYPTTWANGGGNSFYTYADANCLSASGGKMKYRFQITNWQPKQTYRITWTQTTTYTDKTGATSSVPQKMGPIDLTIPGDPTQPYYYYPIQSEVDMPTISYPILSCTIVESPPVMIPISSGTAGSGGPN